MSDTETITVPHLGTSAPRPSATGSARPTTRRSPHWSWSTPHDVRRAVPPPVRGREAHCDRQPARDRAVRPRPSRASYDQFTQRFARTPGVGLGARQPPRPLPRAPCADPLSPERPALPGGVVHTLYELPSRRTGPATLVSRRLRLARRMKVKWCCRPPGVLWDRGRWAQVTDEAKRRCPGLWSATRLCPSRALEMRAPVSHSRRARRPPRRSNCDSASSSRFLAA